MGFVLILIKKMLFGTVMKAAVGHLLENGDLQKKVFFWLAHQIVQRTDTPADDELLRIVEEAMGEKPDISDLPK